MKKKHNTAITTARIGLIQAVLVAFITAGLGVLGTLFQTGNLWPRRDQTSAGSAENALKPAVLNAPYMFFSSKPIDVPLEQCMEQARKGLAGAELTGQNIQRFLASGYRKDTTGYIWCNTDYKVVIFMAAGPNESEASQTYQALQRSF